MSEEIRPGQLRGYADTRALLFVLHKHPGLGHWVIMMYFPGNPPGRDFCKTGATETNILEDSFVLSEML